MGKNFSPIQSVVKNHEDLTLKQMFDVTAQLVNNQDEINGLDKIQWEKYSWTRMSLIGDETVISLQRTKVYVFSDSVLSLGRVLQHPDSNEAWKNRVAGIRSEKSYKDYDAINGESTEFEWNIFPGFTTLQLCDKIKDLLSSLGQTPETYTRRILFMSMFNDISCDRKGNKDECLTNAETVKVLARRFALFFLSISSVSTEQWQPLCEEFEDHQDRTGQPVILVGQSIVLGEVKAEVPVHDEDPREDQIIWQQYIQQVESLSPENNLSKIL